MVGKSLGRNMLLYLKLQSASPFSRDVFPNDSVLLKSEVLKRAKRSEALQRRQSARLSWYAAIQVMRAVR